MPGKQRNHEKRRKSKNSLRKAGGSWEKYALKARAEREEPLKKAQDLQPTQKVHKGNIHGATKYVQNVKYNEQTGEILETINHPTLDLAKVAEDEKYDGYYAIVAVNSICQMPGNRNLSWSLAG